LLKNVAKNPNYELRFQLITVGLDKIYEIIKHNRDELEKEGESEKITEAKMIIIENTCLLMDFIVNFSFDNMIYSIFHKLKNKQWLGDLLWSLKFTEKHIDLLDELTTKEFAFVQENLSNIINEQPIPEYPHENNVRAVLPTKDKVQDFKKQKKERKIKKGPQLTDFKLEL
jgi:ERK and JNK pathways, inhibitor